VRVRVEVGERVVRVGALRAGEEHVLGLVSFRADAERQRVPRAEDREVVLELEAAIAQLVAGRERLEAERGVDGTALEDVHEREERAARVTALVLMRVPDD